VKANDPEPENEWGSDQNRCNLEFSKNLNASGLYCASTTLQSVRPTGNRSWANATIDNVTLTKGKNLSEENWRLRNSIGTKISTAEILEEA